MGGGEGSHEREKREDIDDAKSCLRMRRKGFGGEPRRRDLLLWGQFERAWSGTMAT